MTLGRLFLETHGSGRFFALVVAFLSISACSATATDDPTASDDDSEPVVIVSATTKKLEVSTEDITEGGNEILEVNRYALVFPLGLGFSLWPLPDDTLGTVATQIDADRAVIVGTGDSCDPPILQKARKAPADTCYEPDSSMILVSDANGVISGTQNGLDSLGEPCLLSAARRKTHTVLNLAQQSLGMIAATLCEIRKSELLHLPETGEVYDIQPEANLHPPPEGGVAGKSTIARIGDHGYRPKYRIDLEYTLTGGQVFKISMTHVPRNYEENDTYAGTLTISYLTKSADAESLPMDWFMSIEYARLIDGELNASGAKPETTQDATTSTNPTKNYRVIATLRAAKMVPSLAKEAFTDAGVLKFNPVTDKNGNLMNPKTLEYYPKPELAMSDLNLIRFNQDYLAGTGQLDYWFNKNPFWNEPATSLSFAFTHPSEGSLQGCALEGAAGTADTDALSLRKADKEKSTLAITGFYHPLIQTEEQGTCTIDNSELLLDATGSYLKKTCDISKPLTWYRPDDVSPENSLGFIKKKWGTSLVRQCFIQNKKGKFIIDTTQTLGSSGYDILPSSTLGDKSIAPPDGSKLEAITTSTPPALLPSKTKK